MTSPPWVRCVRCGIRGLSYTNPYLCKDCKYVLTREEINWWQGR